MDVERDHGPIVDLSGRDVPFPLNHERDADAPFPGCRLRAAKRIVSRCRFRRGASVIAEKENESLFFEVGIVEPGEHRSHGVVHRREHGGVRLPLFLSDLWKSRAVVGRRLQRRMRGVEGQVQEERLSLVPIDKRHGFATKRACGGITKRERFGGACVS